MTRVESFKFSQKKTASDALRRAVLLAGRQAGFLVRYLLVPIVDDWLLVPVFQISFIYIVHYDEARFFVIANAMIKFAEYRHISVVVCEEKAILFAHSEASFICGSLFARQCECHLS